MKLKFVCLILLRKNYQNPPNYHEILKISPQQYRCNQFSPPPNLLTLIDLLLQFPEYSSLPNFYNSHLLSHFTKLLISTIICTSLIMLRVSFVFGTFTMWNEEDQTWRGSLKVVFPWIIFVWKFLCGPNSVLVQFLCLRTQPNRT